MGTFFFLSSCLRRQWHCWWCGAATGQRTLERYIRWNRCANCIMLHIAEKWFHTTPLERRTQSMVMSSLCCCIDRRAKTTSSNKRGTSICGARIARTEANDRIAYAAERWHILIYEKIRTKRLLNAKKQGTRCCSRACKFISLFFENYRFLLLNWLKSSGAAVVLLGNRIFPIFFLPGDRKFIKLMKEWKETW